MYIMITTFDDEYYDKDEYNENVARLRVGEKNSTHLKTSAQQQKQYKKEKKTKTNILKIKTYFSTKITITKSKRKLVLQQILHDPPSRGNGGGVVRVDRRTDGRTS